MVQETEPVKKKKNAPVHKEAFEDFAKNSFQVTISRIQQLALQKAGGKLPTPKEQLEMVSSKREAKKSRRGAANHSLYLIQLSIVRLC